MSQEYTAKMLYKIRKAKKLTQKELAEAAYISQQSEALYEHGLRRIPEDTLQKLAEALHIPPYILAPDIESPQAAVYMLYLIATEYNLSPSITSDGFALIPTKGTSPEMTKALWEWACLAYTERTKGMENVVSNWFMSGENNATEDN